MKLNQLIIRANHTYKLGLNKKTAYALRCKLMVAGCRSTVGNDQVSATLDTILAIAPEVVVNPRSASRGVLASATYAALKQEAVSGHGDGGCPRCQQKMREVKLVNRTAAYCGGCHITLPILVDSD